ncbi:hypothetical protein EYZ11_000775 [Aspergillus tanneri]|uniref:N-acetylgalactosaminide beta-1,3-galactosyltransferase n=1 Tax=Aspergillus tanneri TaxID=1220188 RepID=A0A4S3JWA4_9EURO|nr:hypothetical protein EYZ11_000775 [Aspergillus tanneri]
MHKVPIHFNTTLRCIPHFVLFSDFEEDIGGFHLRDVLRNVNESIKQTVADFNLYNRLREGGRSALTTDDMNDDPSTPNGKPENPGWILDKWKFLPMIDETLRIRDDAKWYIFMEADTYLVWPNLMAWLERFDSRKPYYMGSAVQIGDDVFAHGGSGFVLSNIAMRKVSEYRAARIAEWDAFTNGHWAGDGVLGKALKDAGVNLLRSSSMLQGATPWTFGYLAPGKDKGSWCTPAVSYHHMAPSEIQKMWLFERGWSLQSSLSHA